MRRQIAVAAVVLLCAGAIAAQSAPGWHLPYAGIAVAAKDDADALIWLEADANRNLNVNCVTGCAAGQPGQQNMAGSSPVVIASDQSAVPVSGTFYQATQPVSLASLPALIAGNANIGDVDVASLPALPAGNNNIGDVDIASLPSVTVGNFPASQNVVCTSGCGSPTNELAHSAIMANTANPTVVKNAAGTVHTIVVSNNSTTIAYLKLYNKATAPTCGTDAPVMRYQVPATAAGPFQIQFAGGVSFSAGIGYCMVTGIADNSTTAVAASAYLVTVSYK